MTDQIQPVTTQSGLSDNAAGGIAYLTFIPAIIFLVMEPYNRNPFIKFHAWQEILLTGVWFGWFILRIILLFVLHGMWFLWGVIGMVISLGLFILWLIAMIQAFSGKKFSIPVIGAIAEKQANG